MKGFFFGFVFLFQIGPGLVRRSDVATVRKLLGCQVARQVAQMVNPVPGFTPRVDNSVPHVVIGFNWMESAFFALDGVLMLFWNILMDNGSEFWTPEPAYCSVTWTDRIWIRKCREPPRLGML